MYAKATALWRLTLPRMRPLPYYCTMATVGKLWLFGADADRLTDGYAVATAESISTTKKKAEYGFGKDENSV